MVMKADPQIGVSVDTGDRVNPAGFKDSNSKYQVGTLDSSGYLKVNVAAGGAGDGSILDGVSSSIKATVLDLTSSNPLTVAIVDTNGDQISSFGGGTQYTEDAAAAANPVGTALILVREDGLAGALTTTDGDNVAARGNNKGEQFVKHTDSIAVTQGTATNLKAQAENYQGGAAVAAGNPLQVTLANHGANATAVKVNVASGGIASGAIASGAVASGAIASGAVASGAFASGAFASGSIAAGAIAVGATSIADNEDVASAGADTLVKVAQIRQDTPVANASVNADGDYTQFRSDNFGKTWVTASVNEDVAHIAAEPITASGARRIDPCATSSGSDGDWSTVNQSAEGALYTTGAPTTASGLSTFMASGSDGSSILVATSQVIKASAGNLYGYYAYNPEAAVSFVHFYNTASASVTVGTTNPLFTIAIPAGSAANLTSPYGISFSNAGWSCAATTTAGGNTAPATGVSLVVWYK